MKVNTSIHVTANVLPEFMARIPKEIGDVVAKAGFDCQAEAKAIVPVDTGNLKGSITTEKEGDFTAIVSANTDYAGYVEYGTYKMAAQPYMMPAAEIVGPQFVQAIETLVRSLL